MGADETSISLYGCRTRQNGLYELAMVEVESFWGDGVKVLYSGYMTCDCECK